MSNIESFKIENKEEADAYLEDLLNKPDYRSLDEIKLRAQKLIPNSELANYFIAKGAKILE